MANFKIFHNILKAGCHRYVFLHIFWPKGKKKNVFTFQSSISIERKNQWAGSFLTLFRQWTSGRTFALAVHRLFLFVFVLCQGCQLVQLNRYAPPPPHLPTSARGPSSTFWSKSEIPWRTCFCSLMCVHLHVWIHLQFASVCTPTFHQHQPRLPEYMSCT